MTTYKELLQQREALELQIVQARQREIGQAVNQVRALVAEFGLTAQDVFPSGKSRTATTGNKVAAKYSDPATGKTWTGRGKAPKWIEGQDRTPYVITCIPGGFTLMESVSPIHLNASKKALLLEDDRAFLSIGIPRIRNLPKGDAYIS